MSQDAANCEDIFEWRVKQTKPFSPSRPKHRTLEPVNEAPEIFENGTQDPPSQLLSTKPFLGQNALITTSQPYDAAGDAATDSQGLPTADWHLNNPLPHSPSENMVSPRAGVVLSAPNTAFSQTKESIRESLVSRDSVINSRMYKRQFLIELAVRFATLQNLKMLDSTIDSKHLEIGEKLGGGSFGTVCKAKLRGLDVAVKQLNSNTLTPETILALKIEVEILSKLRHPNIVLFIGISMTPTFAAMVTEWCERGSLFDILKSPTERMSAKELVKIALDVARGMWYLHTSEKLLIIHRDVKSPNVLIRLGGSAVVADFGLAVMHERRLGTLGNGDNSAQPIAAAISAATDEDQEFHGNAGTLQWMAPEIIRKEAYGQKVDVYSFGIFITELLTRRMPFRDKYKGLEFKDSVLERNERPTIPSWATWSKGPASENHKLGELVIECTEMNPKRRPNFSQVIDILESLFFTLENNEIRAFEDYDLPRWLEAFDSGDFDEVTHSSYELVEVLDQINIGKATLLKEKTGIFIEHSQDLIASIMARVGFGKAAKLNEDGAEYTPEALDRQVFENLIMIVDYLIQIIEKRDSQMDSSTSRSSQIEMSPSVSASAKSYQVEALVDFFLDCKDEESSLFKAITRILKSEMFSSGTIVKRAIESRTDERMQRKPLASPTQQQQHVSLISLSDESSQFSLVTSDETTETKEAVVDADLAPKRPLTEEEEKILLLRLRKTGLLPPKYKLRGDKWASMGQVAMLEMEIRALEKELALKKRQLTDSKEALMRGFGSATSMMPPNLPLGGASARDLV